MVLDVLTSVLEALRAVAAAYPVWLAVTSLVIAGLALVVSVVNLLIYRKSAPDGMPGEGTIVTVCVPARNEEANIEECLLTLLVSDLGEASGHTSGVEIEVYDDGSTDRTPEILRDLSERDARVVRTPTVPLPEGWNGKQHGCWRAARHARERRASMDATRHWLLFTDADLRFTPDCVRRAVAQAERLNVPMLSTFPRQITQTIAEHALVPMMFFILFSYLPMWWMRWLKPAGKYPGLGVGCGQFLLVRADAYEASGGHAGFKDSMHDGIRLPRAVRAAGFASDLFDGTDLCGVRMYVGLRATWRGFAKNAFEGVGSVPALVVFTALHAVGHLLPWLVLALGLVSQSLPEPVAAMTIATIACGFIQRVILALCLRHSGWAALLHPFGVLGMTLIQWHSLWLARTGQRIWRGRVAGAGEKAVAGTATD